MPNYLLNWPRPFAISWHGRRPNARSPEEVGDTLNAEGLPHPVSVFANRLDDPPWSPREWLFTYSGTQQCLLRSPMLNWRDLPEILRVMQMFAPIFGASIEGAGMHVHLDMTAVSTSARARVLAGFYTYEPLLYALVAAGRRDTGWCDPLQRQWSRPDFFETLSESPRSILRDSEGFATGFTPSQNTLVCRIHHGSFNIRDVVAWTAHVELITTWYLDYLRFNAACLIAEELDNTGYNLGDMLRTYRVMYTSVADEELKLLMNQHLARMLGDIANVEVQPV